MHRLFTFIGLGRYQETTYAFGSDHFTTAFFPLALQHWIQPDEMVFFLTAEAEAGANWAHIEEHLSKSGVSHRKIPIPSGKSETELWTMFDAMTTAAKAGDSITFDITHAFRSLPVLGLLASAFLRRAHGLELRAIYYGAFEAKDPATGIAPVFDLTPFLELLDWLASANKFIDTGDARSIAALLKATQASAHRNQVSNPPKSLSPLASSLEQLSLALALNRPDESATKAAVSLDALERAASDLAAGYARPFATLLGRIRNAYAPLADGTLSGQARLVQWYLDRGQIVQAITLGREWLVSFTCEWLGRHTLDEREVAEEALNHAVFERAQMLEGPPSALLPQLKEIPCADLLTATWSRVRQLRNDIAHCGYRRNALSSQNVQRGAQRLGEDIKTLKSQKGV